MTTPPFPVQALGATGFVVSSDASVGDDTLALFERVTAGDRTALAEFYDRWGAEMYRLALWRMGSATEAADVVQDVFVRLLGAGRALAGVRSPRAYVLTMTHRAAVDRARRSARTEPLPVDALIEAPAHDPGRALEASRLSALLLHLPAAQREALYLHHFADLSFREIAEVTRVPTFTAASRYRLGLARLRRMLRVEDGGGR